MKFFFLFLLTLSSAFADPCGLTGTLDERIAECHTTKGNFALVARDEKGNEIYKDLKSGLIWGDRITSDFNHYGSQKACADAIHESQALKDVNWRLPTINELEQAAVHGMKTSLAHADHAFWSSSPVKRSRRGRRRAPVQAYLWDGLEEKADVGDLKDAASVRCVTKFQ